MTDLNQGPVVPSSPFAVPQQPSPSQPFDQQQWSYSPDEQQGSYSLPPAQYGAGPTGALPVEDKSPMISLICGIVAWLGLWLFTAIPAIIFGVKGRRAAREGRTPNGGMATAGLWLGIVNAVVFVLIIPLFAAIFIPVFLNQRAKGVDAGMKTDLRTMSQVQEAYITNNPGEMGFTLAATKPGGEAKAPVGEGSLFLSPGNVMAAKVGPDGYCVSVYNPGASLAKSPTASMVYRSGSGGLQSGVGVC